MRDDTLGESFDEAASEVVQLAHVIRSAHLPSY
jgi:hypothetical protein